jgi:hypothetical protein
LYLTANIISQILVAVVLKTEKEETHLSNMTTIDSKPVDFDFVNNCGLNNCPSTQLPLSYSKTTQESFVIFYVLLLAIGLSSIPVTLLFMDNLDENSSDRIVDNNKKKSQIEMQQEDIKQESREKITFKLMSKSQLN